VISDRVRQQVLHQHERRPAVRALAYGNAILMQRGARCGQCVVEAIRGPSHHVYRSDARPIGRQQTVDAHDSLRLPTHGESQATEAALTRSSWRLSPPALPLPASVRRDGTNLRIPVALSTNRQTGVVDMLRSSLSLRSDANRKPRARQALAGACCRPRAEVDLCACVPKGLIGQGIAYHAGLAARRVIKRD